MFTTVKIPVMDDYLSPKKTQQLHRLTARDTTVIQRYLSVIRMKEDRLWCVGREGKRLDKTKLDALTLTSHHQKRTQTNGTTYYTQGRPSVKYDLKQQFSSRITVRELKECRDTAVEMWHSYREKVKAHEQQYKQILSNSKYVEREDLLVHVLHWWTTAKKPAPPCQAQDYTPRKLPRRVNVGFTCFLHQRITKLTRTWLELYYPEKKKHLWLPLNLSSYHRNQLQLGTLKTVQLVYTKNKRWYVHCTIKIPLPQKKPEDFPSKKPRAVFAHDLGIKKASVAVLLTEAGVSPKKTVLKDLYNS